MSLPAEPEPCVSRKATQATFIAACGTRLFSRRLKRIKPGSTTASRSCAYPTSRVLRAMDVLKGLLSPLSSNSNPIQDTLVSPVWHATLVDSHSSFLEIGRNWRDCRDRQARVRVSLEWLRRLYGNQLIGSSSPTDSLSFLLDCSF